jgi:hypothetical protein
MGASLVTVKEPVLEPLQEIAAPAVESKIRIGLFGLKAGKGCHQLEGGGRGYFDWIFLLRKGLSLSALSAFMISSLFFDMMRLGSKSGLLIMARTSPWKA